MSEPRREHPISGHSYQSTTTPNSLITVAVVPPNLGFKCGLRLRPRRGLSPQHFTRLDFDLLSVPSSSTVLLISHTRSSSFRDFTETRRGCLILSYVRVKIVSLLYVCHIVHARMRLVRDPFMPSQCSSTRPSVVINQIRGNRLMHSTYWYKDRSEFFPISLSFIYIFF